MFEQTSHRNTRNSYICLLSLLFLFLYDWFEQYMFSFWFMLTRFPWAFAIGPVWLYSRALKNEFQTFFFSFFSLFPLFAVRKTDFSREIEESHNAIRGKKKNSTKLQTRKIPFGTCGVAHCTANTFLFALSNWTGNARNVCILCMF